MKRKENSRGPQKTLLANSCKHILFNTQSYRLDFKNSEFLLKKKKDSDIQKYTMLQRDGMLRKLQNIYLSDSSLLKLSYTHLEYKIIISYGSSSQMVCQTENTALTFTPCKHQMRMTKDFLLGAVNTSWTPADTKFIFCRWSFRKVVCELSYCCEFQV